MALAVLSAVALVFALAPPAHSAQPRVDFVRQIKPLLSSNCFKCHGPDAAERKGGTDGLRLDTAAGALADLGGYTAIVPGQPDKSALVERILAEDPEERMPPVSSGKKLSSTEIDLLKRWIAEGANYVPHWSYVQPKRPEPPVQQTAWARNPIDQFLLARMERDGLRPVPEADRAALVRRLSLDLTGLPPTIEEVDAFAADSDPQAYEKLVDRLLAKPAYGEHWARLWLDLARYADSAGYADDPPRTIWLFRDYVIRAFNANKPFDQFTIEQLAGDLLPSPTQDQLTATAFHRNTLTNNEGGTNDEEFRNVAVVDRVNTTMAVWMGTTMSCAQCHDHKYDPLSQEEYFRLFAFFNESEDADRTDESPFLSVYNDKQQQQRAGIESEIAALDRVLKNPTAEIRSGQARWVGAFPRDLKWAVARPTAFSAETNAAGKILADGAVQVPPGAKNDTYDVEVPFPASPVRALRLETLPLNGLPGRGPGHAADGNFVVTGVSAKLTLPPGQSPRARYVRIELPGSKKLLALAEVQVLAGGKNIAQGGAAHQSSTDFGGAARLAIDGNTDGRYLSASTTQTAASDDPWWEVDLKTDQPVERIVVWNRTDKGTTDGLNPFRVVLLNEKKHLVWQKSVTAAPMPSVQLATSEPQSIRFNRAVADYTQANFDVAEVLGNPDPLHRGWTVGGQTGKPHALTLVTPWPVEAPAGSQLTFIVQHNAYRANHCLGHFRLSLTGDDRAAEYGRTPLDVLEILMAPATPRAPEAQQRLASYYQTIATELEPTRRKHTALTAQRNDIKPLTVPIMKQLAAERRRGTKIQHRGNYMDLGRPVSEGTPAVFPPLPEGSRNRLGLARWLVDGKNPLTARVIANRYWEQIFGIGIVATSEDFGSQGELPFHPELLDWLSTELVRLNWDMKAFVKLLVTSAAYRQSSQLSPQLERRDPENRLLARGPRFRLSAEMVRDQALFAAGLLSPKMYGAPVNPPQPSMGLSAAFGGKIDWQTSAGEDRYRRALYTSWRRSNPYPSMSTFDAPNREVCTLRRTRTNTPLQALVTLNDPVYVEAAQALARRVSAAASDPAGRARLGFRLCMAREPKPEELDRLVKLYERAVAHFAGHAEDARRMAGESPRPMASASTQAELAALAALSNVLLNLDETMMKR